MEKGDRFKFLLHIINKLSSKGDRSGETNIQKLIYFIIRGGLAELPYKYRLHNYGPYSFDLKDELKYMENARMVLKIPDPSGYGFKYIPNKEMPFVKESLKELRLEFPKIDEAIDKFKKYHAKRLGLLATFMYVYQKHKIEDDDKLIRIVGEIKPMFNKWELENTYNDYKSIIKTDKADLFSI